MAISSDEIRGYIDAIILVRLSSSDSYGYEINKDVRELTKGRYEIKEATLYTAFRRLEDGRLIRSYWGESGGGARRRYYRITDNGRKAIVEMLNSYRETREVLDRLLFEGGEEDA